MKTTVQMIIWCVTVTLIFFVPVLVFSTFNSGSTENFFSSVFNGMFASLLVVILCEISRYRSLKYDAEQHICYTNTKLFVILCKMRDELNFYINMPQWKTSIEPKDFYRTFSDLNDQYKLELNELFSIDYTTIIKNKNSLFAKFTLHQEFLYNEKDISIYLTNLKNFLDGKMPAYIDERESDARNMLNKVSKLLDGVNNFNMALDKHFGGRLHWEEKNK